MSELKQVLERLASLHHIQLDGIYAHFANIEDTRDFSHAQKQIDLFEQVINGKCPSKSNCYTIIKIKGISSLGKTKALTEYEKSFYLRCNTLS